MISQDTFRLYLIAIIIQAYKCTASTLGMVLVVQGEQA